MPQPVDPNTEFGRMTAAERIQEISGRANIAAQLRLAAEAAAAQNRADTEVVETDAKTDELEQETKRRNPFGGKRRRGSGKDGERREQTRRPDDNDPHHIDIKV